MQSDTASRPWSTYFSVVSVLLLSLSVVAFSDNLFTNIGQHSNSDPKFIIHGLFGLAWYVLLVTQANLARARSLKLHKRIGIVTFIVAIGVTLSTLYLFIVLWKGWDNMTPEARANRLLLPAYATCVLLAWRNRTDPNWHKRLVFVGTFFMLGPVLSRAFEPLVVSWLEPLLSTRYTNEVDELAYLMFFWGVWFGLFLSLAVYDLKTHQRMHVVTAAAVGCFALAMTVSRLT
jgi:hypothetical protein